MEPGSSFPTSATHHTLQSTQRIAIGKYPEELSADPFGALKTDTKEQAPLDSILHHSVWQLWRYVFSQLFSPFEIRRNIQTGREWN